MSIIPSDSDDTYGGLYYVVNQGGGPIAGYEWAPGVEAYMAAYIGTVNAMCTTAGLTSKAGAEAIDAMFDELVTLARACLNPHKVVLETACAILSEVLRGHTMEIEKNLEEGNVKVQTMLRWSRTSLAHVNTVMRLDRELCRIYGTDLTVQSPE